VLTILIEATARPRRYALPILRRAGAEIRRRQLRVKMGVVGSE